MVRNSPTRLPTCSQWLYYTVAYQSLSKWGTQKSSTETKNGREGKLCLSAVFAPGVCPASTPSNPLWQVLRSASQSSAAVRPFFLCLLYISFQVEILMSETTCLSALRTYYSPSQVKHLLVFYFFCLSFWVSWLWIEKNPDIVIRTSSFLLVSCDIRLSVSSVMLCSWCLILSDLRS